jgi:hypothetical protein
MNSDQPNNAEKQPPEKLKSIEEIIRSCLSIVKEDLRAGVQKSGTRQDALEDYLKDKNFK